MTDMLPEHVAWCRAQVDMIRIGGVWGIPRSGLVFTRTGPDELTLTARMPWMTEMEGTVTREQLLEQQQEEYEETRRHMEAAGVTVKDATCSVEEPFGPDDAAEYFWSCGPKHPNPGTDETR